jgi:hypothetical protein
MSQFLPPAKGDMTARQRRMIEDAWVIEQKDTESAGETGYMIPALVQTTLPHLDPMLPKGMLYSRNSGRMTLTIAPTSQGMEYLTAQFRGSSPHGFALKSFEIRIAYDMILQFRLVNLSRSS